MQRILNAIEATLDADVSAAELAELSGYSTWHFLHLFQKAVGMPLNRYRTRRRLTHAMWHISLGMSITDAALRWGFDSHSGFFRAFRREYGCSPTAYIREHRVREPVVPCLSEEVFKMLTHERFKEALAHWGLDLPLTPVTYPDSGEISESAMYAGDSLVLKAYTDDHACRLAIALADLLHDQGIPAAQAQTLPDGSRALAFHDMWITLCRRVPGKPLRAVKLLDAPEESGLRIGAALAKLHLATAALEDQSCADDQDYAAHLLNWAIPRAREASAFPANFPQNYADQVQQLCDLPRALIHRDPNPSNLIDTAAGIGFIDFDFSIRSVRVFDPCYTATAVLSETYGRDDVPWETAWPLLCRAILNGYDSVTPLTEAEWSSVPTMLIGNELLCLAAFAGSSKFRSVFEVNQQMLGWLIDHIPA
ncbi:MAG: helix-turn-helix domain-containing protein [Clostridia bacterium]|nr:helix-turn-helix domain-containing protein [Clostridia bacterium]